MLFIVSIPVKSLLRYTCELCNKNVKIVVNAYLDHPTRPEMRQIGGGLGGHPPPILHYSTPFWPK